MSLAEFARLPAKRAADWERFALEGPGDYQFGLALAKLLLIADATLGRGKMTGEEAAPWLDAVFGDPAEIRAERRLEERNAAVDSLAAFAKAQAERRRERENG